MSSSNPFSAVSIKDEDDFHFYGTPKSFVSIPKLASFAPFHSSAQELLQSSRKPPAHDAAKQTESCLESSKSSCKHYIHRTRELSKYFPHLKNCSAPSRFNHQKYTVFDYQDQVLLTTKSHVTDQSLSTEESCAIFRNLVKENAPANLTQRVIIVEDLSTQLIGILGSELKIAPEFFEQHLINSGWQDGNYQDCEASTWNTRAVKKPYTCVRWLRPGTFSSPSSLRAQPQCDLLQHSGQLSWNESLVAHGCTKGSAGYEVRHEVTPAVNIIRSRWDLRTHETGKEPSLSMPVLWEERASLWINVEDNVQIGVYPILMHGC